ncbi:growth-regulating factor 5 [Coffea eugenioides]|uniref:Growth-regulating factor n=1 Tax=Coffea arabica TaxID=13443 RepID=A0ABM4UV93_COFAR|nr:growth-regulating factor 5 [Coffea eugenioides]
MMSATTSARSSSRFPFTASQWQELEHQALIFKYMVSGTPVPPDLLYTVRRSLDSSLSSKLLFHQPQLGWNSCFQMGFGRKIDPEPGRCRRTDGKKWRCSKEAYPDSKYCERHMHRGRNRSRKPVEQQLITTPIPPPPIISPSSISNNNTSSTATPPTAIPITSISKNHPPSPSSPTSHHSFSCLTSLATSSESQPHHHHHHHNHGTGINQPGYALHHPLLYPHSSCVRPPGTSHDRISSEENSTNYFLGSGPYSQASKGYSSYGQGGKEEVDEHAFFCEASGTVRNLSGGSSVVDHDGTSSWQLAPLTMGSPSGSHLKQRSSYSVSNGGHSSYLQLQSLNHDNDYNTTSRQQKQASQQQYYGLGDRDDHQNKRVMHRFFDEWPPKDNKDSCWLDNNDHHDHKLSKIQLSISMPNASSHHDFFMTRNEKMRSE